jgi:hypothetical protein
MTPSCSLIRGSLTFTLSVFPLPGLSEWFGLALDFTRLLSYASLPSACAGWELTWTLVRDAATQPRLLNRSDFVSRRCTMVIFQNPAQALAAGDDTNLLAGLRTRLQDLVVHSLMRSFAMIVK